MKLELLNYLQSLKVLISILILMKMKLKFKKEFMEMVNMKGKLVK